MSARVTYINRIISTMTSTAMLRKQTVVVTIVKRV